MTRWKLQQKQVCKQYKPTHNHKKQNPKKIEKVIKKGLKDGSYIPLLEIDNNNIM